VSEVGVWTQSTEEIQRGCLATATVHCIASKLAAVRYCASATQALAEDWLTTKQRHSQQHHSQSPSRRDENFLEATEEPYWEEEHSTNRSKYQTPGSTPEQQGRNRILYHDISYKL